MSKYLGNNYWLLDDGKLLNTKRGTLITNVPAIFKYKKSMGNHEVYENTDFRNMESERQFVMFDFCENIRRHKQTVYVGFSKFQTIDYTNRKINDQWVKFNHGFIANNAYMLFCEINHQYPDSLKIIKNKRL